MELYLRIAEAAGAALIRKPVPRVAQVAPDQILNAGRRLREDSRARRRVAHALKLAETGLGAVDKDLGRAVLQVKVRHGLLGDDRPPLLVGLGARALLIVDRLGDGARLDQLLLDRHVVPDAGLSVGRTRRLA